MQSIILFGLISASIAHGQATFNNNNNTFSCAIANGAYCAGNSLSTPIIIRCNGFQGQPGNCNDNLAGVPPVGVKVFAPCYQSGPTVGDAACSYNGIVYPENGSAPFPVNSTASNSSTTTTQPSTSSNIAVSSTTTTITSCSVAACPASTTATSTTSVPVSGASQGTTTSSHPAIYTPGNAGSVNGFSGLLAAGALAAMML